MKQALAATIAFAVCLIVSAQCRADAPANSATEDPPVVVRCAVIGGMTDTGFWQALSERFEAATGIRCEVVATGPKHDIAGPFRRGEADIITMHASDTIINLVADGYGIDPQPWARNDLLLVGPPSDPAGIKGTKDAAAALKKVIESRSKILIHESLGANEVLHDVLAAGGLTLDLERTIVLPSDRNRQLLQKAASEQAYTIVGRIPFLNGKIANDGLQIMVQGDPRLRRPYVVIVATAATSGEARHAAARRLAEFMRQRETQTWIVQFGRGQWDDQPFFFPVVVPDAAK